MKIFDRLFKLKQHKPTENSGTDFQLSDLVLDWFKKGQVARQEFENDYLQPLLKALADNNEYLSTQFAENNEEVLRQYFEAYSIQYLSFKTQDNIFMDKVLRLVTVKDSPYYSLGRLLMERIDWRIKEALPVLENLEIGKTLLAIYHAIYLRDGYNSLDGSGSLDSMVSNGKFGKSETYFRTIFNYVCQQDFDKKPFVMFNLYMHKKWDYHREMIVIENPYQEEIAIALENSILEYNKTHGLKLDFGVTKDIAALFDYGNTAKWNSTGYKDRKKLRVKDFEEIKNMVTHVRKNPAEALQNIFYYLGNQSVYDAENLFAEALGQITAGVQFDKGWLLKIIGQSHIYNYEIFVEQVTTMLVNIREQLSYREPLVTAYEQFLFGHGWHFRYQQVFKAGVKLLLEIAGKIDDETERGLYRQRLNPYMADVCHQYGHYNLVMDEKDKSYKVIRALIDDLNRIIPVALKNVPRVDPMAYYDSVDVPTFFEINRNGKDEDVSLLFIDHINNLLYNEGKGYQLVAIPIIHHSEHRKDYYISSLAYMSHNEYQYFYHHYLIDNFPQLVKFQLYASIRFCDANSVSFMHLKGQMAQQPPLTQNKFLADINWAWFKDKYIDNLSSREQWYDIMDTMVDCPSGKKPNTKWLASVKSKMEKFGRDKYFRELQSLLSESFKEDFWFFDTYRNALRGFIWTCTQITPTDESMNIVRNIIERSYAKVPNVGPKSATVGNFALEALVLFGQEEVFGVLNIMRNKSRYNRFIKVLDKYIDWFMKISDIPEQLLADKAIPRFGFVDGIKNIPVGDHKMQVYFKGGKIEKQWMGTDGKRMKSVPGHLKEQYPSELKEANDEVKQLNAIYTDLKKRISTYWLFNRSWQAKDWLTYIFTHPLMLHRIENLIWTNQTRGIDFIIRDGRMLTIEGVEVQPEESDTLVLWHPVINTGENVAAWQEYIWESGIVQGERQAFREHYPFSVTESANTQSGRFANHFLEVKKLMAVANAAGWIFTYVHEGRNWPRIYVKELNITAHIRCDYNRNDFAIPTKELFFTEGNTTNINEWPMKLELLILSDVPPVFLSEICRDIDLFIATTNVGHNPELADRQEMKDYYMQYWKGVFSDNAVAKIRRSVIEKLIPVLKIKSSGFEGNYLVVEGSLNSYRINLGSGFAQIRGSQKHINIIPSIDGVKKNKTLRLPIEDDDTLYLILAKALFLQNDAAINDEKILMLLK
jgi:hypothetical protein